MDRIVKPRIVDQGGTSASRADGGDQPVGGGAKWSEDSAHTRLLKYVPLEIAGAYPLIENVIAGWVLNDRDDVFGLTPIAVGWSVFSILLFVFFIGLHRTYGKHGNNKTRWSLQIRQMFVSAVALAVWTYSIKSVIWTSYYEPGVALIAVIIFLAIAGNFVPAISEAEARESGFLAPKSG